MKKLTTLLVAMLFTAGMAFAQSNDATIDQVGDDHEAMIEQLGSINKAYVDQTDGGSNGDAFADISQQGDENSVNLLQRAFYGFPDQSSATITQIGNNNSVQGTTASSAFYQNQPGGIVDVYMEGDNNTLYSLAGEAQKNGNEYLLEIFGDGNSAGMMQEFATADISIDGNDNNVVTSQKSPGAAWDTAKYSDATVDILGDFNSVDIFQNSQSNSAVVDITGSNNSSSISQQ